VDGGWRWLERRLPGPIGGQICGEPAFSGADDDVKLYRIYKPIGAAPCNWLSGCFLFCYSEDNRVKYLHT